MRQRGDFPCRLHICLLWLWPDGTPASWVCCAVVIAPIDMDGGVFAAGAGYLSVKPG
ncbi:MAG: hypothetical protein WCA51_04310 [Dehalococcoidia bacterium]